MMVVIKTKNGIRAVNKSHVVQVWLDEKSNALCVELTNGNKLAFIDGEKRSPDSFPNHTLWIDIDDASFSSEDVFERLVN